MNREIRPVRRNDKTNWRKVRSMGSLGALGFIMLFQYQNCAPATRMHQLGGASNDGSIVTVIDNPNATTAVGFAQAKLQLPASQDPTMIEGECSLDQDGAVLGWRVYDSVGNELERGYSTCSQGKFEVEMQPSSDLQCGQSYALTARLNTGTEGQIELVRECGTGLAAQSPAN